MFLVTMDTTRRSSGRTTERTGTSTRLSTCYFSVIMVNFKIYSQTSPTTQLELGFSFGILTFNFRKICRTLCMKCARKVHEYGERIRKSIQKFCCFPSLFPTGKIPNEILVEFLSKIDRQTHFFFNIYCWLLNLVTWLLKGPEFLVDLSLINTYTSEKKLRLQHRTRERSESS